MGDFAKNAEGISTRGIFYFRIGDYECSPFLHIAKILETVLSLVLGPHVSLMKIIDGPIKVQSANKRRNE